MEKLVLIKVGGKIVEEEETLRQLLNDFAAIEEALSEAETVDKPVAIIANTVKGKGVDFMENQVSWHGTAPNAEQYADAIAQIDRS